MAATYPAMLAAGLTAQTAFDPFQLYAGESDIVTDQGQAGGTDLEQFRVIAMNEAGLLVPWDPTAGTANKAGTFSAAGTDADTITINGVVLTLKPAAANSHQVTIGADAAHTATNFAAVVNAIPDELNVRAVAAGAVVTLYALEEGSAGNAIAISEASTSFSFAGGATALSGGTAQSEHKPVGITAQPILAGVKGPYFTGGTFNHQALVWPASIDTLAERKLAFAGSNIGVRQLL